MEKNKIIIIPTFNELKSIRKVIKDCPKDWNILVDMQALIVLIYG